MLGVKYQATEREARAVAEFRLGVSLPAISRKTKLSVEEVIAAYDRYIEQRIAAAAGPESRRVNEQYLDRLDALIEKYFPFAAKGDQASARLVASLIQAVITLRERVYRLELFRQSSAPKTEMGKAAESGALGTAKERWDELVRLRDEHGIPIPPEVALAYREILLAGE